MAEQKLSWVFEIFDKITAPAKKMADALKRLSRGMGDVGESSKRAKGPVESLGMKLMQFVVIGRGVYSALHSVEQKLLSLAKAFFRVVGIEQDAQIALSATLGSGREATEMIAQAEEIAIRVGQPVQDFTVMAKTLSQAGFSFRQISTMLKAAGDIAVLQNPGAMQGFIEMLRSVGARGEVPVVRVIQSLNEAGIKGEGIWKRLAEIYGLTGDRVAKLKQEFMKDPMRMVNAGAVLRAALLAVTDETHAPLGSLGVKHRGTIGGQMTAMENNWNKTLESLAGGPGMKALQSAFENLIKMGGPSGVFGKALRQFMDGPVAKFFEQFAGPEGAKRLQGAFQGVLDVVIKLTEAVKGLVQFAQGVTSPTKGLDIQNKIGDATYKSLHAGGLQEAAAAGGLLGSMGWTLSHPLMFGQELMEHMGLSGQKGGVVPPPAVQPATNSKKSDAGPSSINFHIDAKGIGKDTLDTMMDRLRDEVPPMLASALEGFAVEGGAA